MRKGEPLLRGDGGYDEQHHNKAVCVCRSVLLPATTGIESTVDHANKRFLLKYV
jgi:hypothetical protein